MNIMLMNILGAGVKHILPWKSVNKFIPLINMGVGVGLRMAGGGDVAQAAIGGVADAIAAVGTHKTAQQVKGLDRI